MLNIRTQAAASMESNAAFGDTVRDLAVEAFGLTESNRCRKSNMVKRNGSRKWVFQYKVERT